jgi:hypothetical protein
MAARITQRLDPAYRQTDAYTHAPQEKKDMLESAAKREQVLAPFSALQVKMRVERLGDDDGYVNVLMGQLCFVRVLDDGFFPRTETREYAKLWTRCPHTVVAELREKLHTVFRVELPECDVLI